VIGGKEERRRLGIGRRKKTPRRRAENVEKGEGLGLVKEEEDQ